VTKYCKHTAYLATLMTVQEYFDMF